MAEISSSVTSTSGWPAWTAAPTAAVSSSLSDDHSSGATIEAASLSEEPGLLVETSCSSSDPKKCS